MNKLRLLVVVCLAIGLKESVAEQAPAPAPTEKEPQKLADLDVRYAEVYLQLTKLEFARAVDINRQIPGTFTNAALEALRQSVVIAQEQLNDLQAKGNDRKAAYLISAQASAKGAEAAYLRALRINEQSPGTIVANELERLRLSAELAKLSLQKAETVEPANVQQFLQWQVDQLREELYQLKTRLAQIQRMN
jgi:hypothetical protein